MKQSVYGFIAAMLAAAPAIAVSSARFSDVEFIEANRCLALMTSKALGTADAAALERRLNEDAGGRPSFIFEKADEARDDAARQASRARGDVRAKLVTERDGVCRSLLPGTTVAAQPLPRG